MGGSSVYDHQHQLHQQAKHYSPNTAKHTTSASKQYHITAAPQYQINQPPKWSLKQSSPPSPGMIPSSSTISDQSLIINNRAPSKILPVLVATTAVAAVVGYVNKQLSYERKVMDQRFAQYNTPQSEEARRKTFEGAESEDPRKSAFNVLGW